MKLLLVPTQARGHSRSLRRPTLPAKGRMLPADKVSGVAAEINGGLVEPEISLKCIEISMRSREIPIESNSFP